MIVRAGRRVLPPSLPSGIDITFHPALDYRDTNEWAGTAKGHGNTSAALDYDGLNTPGIGEQQVEYAPPGFAHTSYALLSRSGSMSNHPPPELWNTHREWFCTNNDGLSAAPIAADGECARRAAGGERDAQRQHHVWATVLGQRKHGRVHDTADAPIPALLDG